MGFIGSICNHYALRMPYNQDMVKVDIHGLEQRFEARQGSDLSIDVADRVLEAAGGVGGLGVLDVGCGTGELCRRLADRGAAVSGIDLCANLLSQAGGVGVAKADAAALPFGGRRFDLATSVLVLHYLPDPDRALAEIARVLRPGGRLVVCDRVCSSDPVLRAAQIGVERLRNPLIQRILSAEQLEESLRKAGFEAIRLVEFRRWTSLEAWLSGTDPARASDVRDEVFSLRGRDLGGFRVAPDDRIELRLALAEARIS
jgi:ubiquinone/menaquinone biosynthesis C-methylase UbiE